MKLLRDTWICYRRAMLERLRTPGWVIVSVLQPLLYLFLFGPLLAQSGFLGQTPSDTYNSLVPGLIVLMTYFVAGGAGFGLLEEVAEGVIERFQVTPISRAALVLGRAGRDVTAITLQSLLVLGLGALLGLRPSWGGALLALLLVVLLALALSAISNVIAFKMGSGSGFAALFNGLSIPVLLLSGILLPLSLGPAWLDDLGYANPLRYVVDAARALIDGQMGGVTTLRGFAVVGALVLIGFFLSVRLFQHTSIPA